MAGVTRYKVDLDFTTLYRWMVFQIKYRGPLHGYSSTLKPLPLSIAVVALDSIKINLPDPDVGYVLNRYSLEMRTYQSNFHTYPQEGTVAQPTTLI